LPDISALNGTAIDSVAEFDGLTVTAAVAFTGLLDTYTGAAAGYSTRRLASSATNLMRIREDAGDTETDIGYDSNNELDTAAIATHCGTANGFVVSWVDQSGNSNDADQSTNGSQPKIYDGTTQAVITENGKPVLTCGNGQQLEFTDSSGTNNTFTAVIHQDATRACLISNTGGNVALGLADSGSAGTDFGFGTPTYFVDGSSFSHTRGAMYTASLNQILFTAITGDPAQTTLVTGYATATSFYSYNMQELIQWPSDQTSPTNNRTGIEANINSDFLIYQPTDAPTSGLLATYTGAAAAYSVRQLSDKAVIALRIRRDSDDEETNIGFDSNGDLDTTAISDFCSTANGFVTRWWDQSTNGNHADQATDAIQPQIYNGTAVITENGKPYLKYGFLTTAVNFGTDNWIFSACGNISNNTKLFFAGSGSSYVGLAQSGSTSSTINSGAGTLTAFRNGSSYSFTTRDALYTDIGTQSLFTINQDNSGWTNVNLGYTGSVDQRMYSLHEVVIYDTDQSTNRTGIESDMNTYFSIY